MDNHMMIRVSKKELQSLAQKGNRTLHDFNMLHKRMVKLKKELEPMVRWSKRTSTRPYRFKKKKS